MELSICLGTCKWLYVFFFFPASPLFLGYTLEQLLGKGYLGGLQGRKEKPPWYNWEGRYGGLALSLFVFGTETCSVLRWDGSVQAINVTHVTLVLRLWLQSGDRFYGLLCHSNVGPAKSQYYPLCLSLSGRQRQGLGQFLYPCIQITHGRAFRLTENRQGHSREKAGKLLTSLPVLGLSE